jgi:hypothetical protein
MKRVLHFLDVFVFIAATLAIAAVFYEGMVLEWFAVVGIFFIIMDSAFMLSTVANLIYFRKSKATLIFSLVSLVMIVIALSSKGMGIEHPAAAVVFWFFYIWFYYGVRISKILWFKPSIGNNQHGYK